MATTLYPTTVGGGVDNTRWRGDTAIVQSGLVNSIMSGTSPGTSGNGVTFNTVNGPNARILTARWHTQPLAADITISGTITCNIGCQENSMSANAGVKVEAYRLQPNGTVTLIGSSAASTEMATSGALRSVTITPTSTDFKAGDTLAFLVIGCDASGTTMATGFTFTIWKNGASGSGSDTNFVITENLTFIDTTAPTGTQVFHLDTLETTANDSSGLTLTERVAQLGTSPTPPTFSVSESPLDLNVTSPAFIGSSNGECWFTPPLQAVTIPAGNLQVNLDIQQSSAANNASWQFFLYKTSGDGSAETLLVKAWFADTASVASIEMPTSSSGMSNLVANNEIVISDGERLKIAYAYMSSLTVNVIEFGATSSDATTPNSGSVTMEFGGTTKSFVRFGATLAEFTPAFSIPAGRMKQHRRDLQYR